MWLKLGPDEVGLIKLALGTCVVPLSQRIVEYIERREAEDASDLHKAYVKQAKAELNKDGELEFDADAVVSTSDEGAYVMGWVWVQGAEGGRVIPDEMKDYTDTAWCGHCDAETPHTFHDSGHERDSSNDWQRCKECGWALMGHAREYQQWGGEADD